MLNRIGLPLAKKMRREKQLAIRKELKMSLERETMELIEYSKPEKSSKLVEDYYQQEEKRENETRQKLYQRIQMSHASSVPERRGSQLKKEAIEIVELKPTESSFVEDYNQINPSIDYSQMNFQSKKQRFTNVNQNRGNQSQKKPRREVSTAMQSTRRNINTAANASTQLSTTKYSMIIEQLPQSLDSNIQSQYNKSSQQSIRAGLNNTNNQKLDLIQEEIKKPQTPIKLIKRQVKQRNTTLSVSQERVEQFQLNEKESQAVNNQSSQFSKILRKTFEIKKNSLEQQSDNSSSSQRKNVRFYDFKETPLSKLGPLTVSTNHHNQTQFRDLLLLLKQRNQSKLQRQGTFTRDAQQITNHLGNFIKQVTLTPGMMVSPIANNKKVHHQNSFNNSGNHSLQVQQQHQQHQQQHSAHSQWNLTQQQYSDLLVMVDQYQQILESLNLAKSIFAKRPAYVNQTYIEQKKWQIILAWFKGIEVCRKNADFLLIFNALKINGEIYLEFKDFTNAIKEFSQLKNYCDEQKHYKEKIICYEQLGICHRLLEDHQGAIKFFRKQLELAWEQKEDKYEINACGNLALEYFYVGDLEKANHFNDRMMRGKLETDVSVIKRVSNNLIHSKRKRPKYEFYLKPEQLNAYLQKKQNQAQGMTESIDFGLSKAYRLLPNFCEKEEEDILSNDGDENENENGQKEKKEQTIKSSLQQQGPNFQTPQLKHLNIPPPYTYLVDNDPLRKKHIKQRSIGVSLGGSATNKGTSNAKKLSLREYIGSEHFKYELPSSNSTRHQRFPSGIAIYQQILDRVKKNSGRGHQGSRSQGQSNLSHQSLLRMFPKEQITYAYTQEALERSFDLFKQIMKKQMLLTIRKFKLGIEFEEICYNI